MERRSIRTSKSAAAQVDGCRAAIQRAEARRQKHIDAAAQSQTAAEKETQNIAEMTKELAELEVQFAAAAVSPPNPHRDATMALTRLLSEMDASEMVPQEHVAEAKQLANTLISGAQQISEYAQQRAQLQQQQQQQQHQQQLGPVAPVAPVTAAATAAGAGVAVEHIAIGSEDDEAEAMPWQPVTRLRSKTSRVAPYAAGFPAEEGRSTAE